MCRCKCFRSTQYLMLFDMCTRGCWKRHCALVLCSAEVCIKLCFWAEDREVVRQLSRVLM